jgi:hypothetical protein
MLVPNSTQKIALFVRDDMARTADFMRPPPVCEPEILDDARPEDGLRISVD